MERSIKARLRLACGLVLFGLTLAACNEAGGEAPVEESWDEIIAQRCPRAAEVPAAEGAVVAPGRPGASDPCGDARDHAAVIAHIEESLATQVDVEEGAEEE